MIFAANHASHVDAPLMLTSIPRPWRSRLVVGAGADYFFATRVTGTLSALALGAIPIHLTEQDPKKEVRAATGGAGVDVAVDAVGNPEPLALAISLARMAHESA